MTHTTSPHPGNDARYGSEPESAHLAEESIQLVRTWLAEASTLEVDASAAQLAGILKDPGGLAFTVGFVDGVIRPEDLQVAARNLAKLAPQVPDFLPWYLKTAVRTGGVLGPAVPSLVVPAARRALRRMVGHLIIDASEDRLGQSIARLRRDGVRLNMNLLGEAVLGRREAERRLEGTRRLLERRDVDYVSIKVSSTVAPHAPWAFDEAVADVAETLAPLYRLAAESPRTKFINLDMEEYKDLELTMAVFMELLSRPEFHNLEAGLVLQAYLPDALAAMQQLQDFAAARRAAGGAPVKVRLVKGANLPMEQVEASLHGWPLATWGSKLETDTNYKRVLEYSLHPERIRNVRIGVAGHNLFDIAYAWLLAGARGVRDGIDVEMLLGMAAAQAEVVRKEVGSLLLYTPVVHPQEFDVAIAYLVRRLEEGASGENFMSAVFDLASEESLFEREKQRFLDSLAAVDSSVPAPRRQQDRTRVPEPGPDDFANSPDTDPSLPANRGWGRDILSRVPGSDSGRKLVAESRVETEDQLDELLNGAVTAQENWAALGGTGRAEILHRAGDILEARRARLLEVMAAEAGKTLDQGDPEVSEAIDFARYYAERARELDTVDGARFHPARLTLVTPPWNFPVAIPAGSTLAALAAGSSVVLKPAGPAARCGAVLAEALWEAGVPRDVLRFVQLGESELGRELISHPAVDRVILTGAYETAELFRSFRPDLELLAETSGKNAIVVTPSADFDLAARDVAASAFGHAGQKCSAASLVILVGSVAESRRFHHQLLDAVQSLVVGQPEDPRTQMGPVIEPAAGKLLRGLTELGPGETWVLQPQKLDADGRLWSPGIRAGVQPGSEFHLTEYFGPVLGVLRADTLQDAVRLQNQVDYGLTAGLHSLDPEEIRWWTGAVEAGNLYVNRGITGAIVRRQPFGGWKKSSVGAGTKAGGPNYLLGLGSWSAAPSTADAEPGDKVRALLDQADGASVLSSADLAFLHRAAASDAAVWAAEFGQVRDVSGLSAERNLFRYLPVSVHVRLAESEPLPSVLRVLSAALLAEAAVTVSVPEALAPGITAVLAAFSCSVTVENDAEWLSRMAAADTRPSRIRLLGGDRSALAGALGGRPDCAVYAQPVTESGRIELLPFLHEQAISITAHRFGTPSPIADTEPGRP
ncbi:bifunctional proline dehydrogenase/L-glutamate gamma-semialdehyde dehydrogenase [Arthrobacter gandavensis]|uniref:bifunctional proline dehydrogenase/L-glutamate gamma-semialdehyde dehydrogenase n=1 Tax=Arthrobacter gandavensis TaxID=169960 RepID=UPI00188ECEAF|nr:bifunctional proline dehydrogenase/L-glutamate gamma-semialdehyde dehydrogenase [Arthrobacter gandavensis]MBF4994270.1 bifunctional proline dehydrogenase/L-glutamate gamma-semialdehyde dehydrogenase [Arthrobacter gandavensis]